MEEIERDIRLERKRKCIDQETSDDEPPAKISKTKSTSSPHLEKDHRIDSLQDLCQYYDTIENDVDENDDVLDYESDTDSVYNRQFCTQVEYPSSTESDTGEVDQDEVDTDEEQDVTVVRKISREKLINYVKSAIHYRKNKIIGCKSRLKILEDDSIDHTKDIRDIKMEIEGTKQHIRLYDELLTKIDAHQPPQKCVDEYYDIKNR